VIVQRTLAEYLATKITGLAVYKDDLAFSAHPVFPYLLTNLVSAKRENLGAGIRDFVSATEATKIRVDETTLRFTVRAVSTEEETGNTIVSALVRQADEVLRHLTRTGGITLTDSVTGLPVRIAYCEYSSESDIQPHTDRLPVVYQKALTYQFRIIAPSTIQEASDPTASFVTQF